MTFTNLARMLRFTHLLPCADNDVILSYTPPNTAIVQHHAVSPEKFKKIHRLVHSCETTLNLAIDTITSAGYSVDVAKSIVSLTSHYDTGDNLLRAIIEKITLDEFVSNNRNIIEFISGKFSIEKQLLIDLLFYEPPTKPISGKGEAFIVLLVAGGKKPLIGDAVIGDKTIEIKGTCARIGGQKGYGSPFAVVDTFNTMTSELVTRADVDLDCKGRDYNVRFTKNGYLDSIAPILIETGNVDASDIASVYRSAYQTFYSAATYTEFNWIDNHITETGSIQCLRAFIDDFFHFSLQYYQRVEKFDNLVVISSATTSKKSAIQPGFFQILNTDDILDKSSALLKVGPHSPPTFGTSAPQDKFFAIKVKP